MPELLALYGSVIFVSLSGVMMPGPMFAVTLAKSYKTPFAGAWLSIGHAVVEVPVILLIYFGFARFFENQIVQVVLSLAGGAMIIYLAISMYRARHEVVTEKRDVPYSAFVAGMVMSVLNPFFLLWWATLGSMLIMKVIPFGAAALIGFMIVHWLCDLVWLSTVSGLVYKTHNWWGGKVQLWVFVLNSLFLAGFGGWFIYSGLATIL
ncbi:MAG: LysE family transporter [Dehalococcoidales bacterium]|jgi:threonine/homoserine/homoserine lactone efflux protein|nr:LysE family transporter [Dehalococcoidales bacterium]MDD4230091.1 LysE family transporter [Dehalococcoidales bacterium]MDD4465691.1 LysE family transporter [Dehalococcoidales bacterium]MDD5401917.1 LysE family transporter [Dehalococcoidales bacterium]